jgi:hypothetical protein
MEAKMGRLFVDKSMLLEDLALCDTKYICVPRPRQFGKSVALAMIDCFFNKRLDSASVFSGLEIGKTELMNVCMNKFNVISIDCELPLQDVKSRLEDDIREAYPGVEGSDAIGMLEFMRKVHDEKFMILIDNWDSWISKNAALTAKCDEYTEFVKGLAKDRAYVELVYMTGVSPANGLRYEGLDFFTDYAMHGQRPFCDRIGFTEDEVETLCIQCDASTKKADLLSWFGGYRTHSGKKICVSGVVSGLSGPEC